MKKTLLLKTMLLLCALVAGSLNGWADVVTFDATTDVDATAQMYQDGPKTYTAADGSEWIAAGYGATKQEKLVIGKGGANYLETPKIEGRITSIAVTWSGNTSYYLALQTVSGTELDAKSNPASAATETFTISSGDYTKLRLVGRRSSGTSNAAATITKVVVTYEASGTSLYTITPATNNSDWGSVSLSGSTITATPATGYRVSTTTPYEVTSGEAKVTQNGNTFTVNPSSNCTVKINFEAIPTYAVTIETPTGGTLTVMNGNEEVTSGEEFVAGTKLTITATPGADYNFKNWQAVDGSTHTYTASSTGTYTIGEHAVTFKASFTAKIYHSVNWSVNGNVTTDTKIEEGTNIVFPVNPADVDEKTFVGWSESAITGTSDTAPTFVTSATMGTSDLTFYAVFAEKTISGGEETKSFGFETESDDDWYVTPAIARSTDCKNSGTYSGKINTSNTYVTFNDKVKVKEFSFAFTRTSTNSNYNVYIETSEDNTNLTAVETYPMSDFNSDQTFKTKSHTFDGTKDLYVRFHCYNTTAARYVDDVTIKYDAETISYSNYCTTVAPDTRTAVNITSFTATNTTIVKGNTTATSVENDQAGWTAAYTYESDNTDVATVATDGVITAVAKGTANITVKLNVDKDDTDYKAGETKSMSIEITVKNPKHSVKFYNNGTEITASSAEVEEGDDIVFPVDPTAPFAGYSFIGWATAAIDGTAAEAPTTVTSATMGTSDVNFYAVFGDVQKQNVTATFDASDISNLTASGTREWTDKSTGIIMYISNGQRYTGSPNAWNVTASGTSDYYMSIGRSNCAIKKVVTTVTSSTYAFGDHYAYDNYSDDVFEEGQDLTLDVTNSENVYTWVLNDNYEKVALWSASSQVRATKIVVDAVIESTTTYLTTIPTENVTITNAMYATYCSTNALNFGATDVKAYKAKCDENGKVKLTEIENGVVPANTGVMLYCETADTYAIPVTTTEVTVSDNEMVGTTELTPVPWESNGKYNYILQKDDNGNAKFFKATGAKLIANRAYLSTTYDVSATTPGARSLDFVFDDGETTGIADNNRETITNNGSFFDLQGRKVANPTKGLYIVNGKKVVVK